ncbi:MAG: hypothetical protein SFY80_01315 [Verrucomicrobiota bacterium]|nr:hypothetical protein [Verrucomicrobiota bacterium]
MPGKNTRISPLALRKEILIAESNLNRSLIFADMAGITGGVSGITHRIKNLGSLAASAVVLVCNLSSCKRSLAEGFAAKPSLLTTLIQGGTLVLNLWQTFHPKGDDSKPIRDPFEQQFSED